MVSQFSLWKLLSLTCVCVQKRRRSCSTWSTALRRAPKERQQCGRCRSSSSSSVPRLHTPSPKTRWKKARPTRWEWTHTHAYTHTRAHTADTHTPRPVLSCLQKLFLDSLRKALAGQGGSKQLMESAAIACVKLCKASTYINWEDHSTIFLLVQSIVMDLKVWLLPLFMLCLFALVLLLLSTLTVEWTSLTHTSVCSLKVNVCICVGEAEVWRLFHFLKEVWPFILMRAEVLYFSYLKFMFHYFSLFEVHYVKKKKNPLK